MKIPKPGITSGFSRNFVFLIKWEFDKMGSFDQNPCSLERNGIPFYQEGTVQYNGLSVLPCNRTMGYAGDTAPARTSLPPVPEPVLRASLNPLPGNIPRNVSTNRNMHRREKS